MKDKYRERLAAAAAELMVPDDAIEALAFCVVGQVNRKREFGRAAITGVVSTALTGGLLTAAVMKQPAKLYLAATRRGLFFFDGSTLSGAPGRHESTIDRRAAFLVGESDGRLAYRRALVVTVGLTAEDRALKITFGAADMEAGRIVAASLARADQPEPTPPPRRPRPSPG